MLVSLAKCLFSFPKYILGGWIGTAWSGHRPQWPWQRQVCRSQVTSCSFLSREYMYIQSLLTGHSNHSSMTIWGKKPRITSPGLPTQRYCNVWILSNWTFMWALQRKFSHRTELRTYLMLLCKGGRSESSNRSWSDCLCLEPLQTRSVSDFLETNRGELEMCVVM